jgi:hypothetical protein
VLIAVLAIFTPIRQSHPERTPAVGPTPVAVSR